jgi:hypothetical protein
MTQHVMPAQILLLSIKLNLYGDWARYADEDPVTKRRKWRRPSWKRMQECDYANPSAYWRYGPLTVDVVWKRTGVS